MEDHKEFHTDSVKIEDCRKYHVDLAHIQISRTKNHVTQFHFTWFMDEIIYSEQSLNSGYIRQGTYKTLARSLAIANKRD